MILPAGKVVDSSFTIPKPGDPTATLNPVVGISNYEYEVLKNNKKRTIYILKKIYLNNFCFFKFVFRSKSDKVLKSSEKLYVQCIRLHFEYMLKLIMFLISEFKVTLCAWFFLIHYRF